MIETQPKLTRKEFNFDALRARYDAMTVQVSVRAELVTDLVGGQPADDKGIAMFVKHAMGLEGTAAEEEIRRIKTHEIALRPKLLPEGAELTEEESKAVNIIRRDDYGPWLGDWMIKANIKNAASRVGLFVQVSRSKGDLAEMGLVQATGISLYEPDPNVYNRNRIYLRDAKGGPAQTEMQTFKGRVSTPQGSASIVTVSEACKMGAQYEYNFRFFDGKVTTDDIVDVFAASMIIGCGSAKAFERGKFKIIRLIEERGEKVSRGKPETSKKEVKGTDIEDRAKKMPKQFAEDRPSDEKVA